MTLYLDYLGANVSGYSLKPNTKPSLFEDVNLEEVMSENHFGDINNYEEIINFLKTTKPSILFHLAAQPLVRESFDEPLQTFETNILGTAKVIKAALEVDTIECIVVITSDKCYKNQEQMKGYCEEDPLGGDDPYSASKAATEIVSQSFRKSFMENSGKNLATVRAGNVIGGGDWAKDRLVPDCVKAFNEKETLSIRRPNSIRPWQHVLEPLRGYIMLAENLCSKEGRDYADAWNFAPSYEAQKTVEEVVKEISKEWKGADWKVENNGPKETNLLLLDNTKAINLLRWKPILDFRKTIDMTTSWYKGYFAGENVTQLSRNQLKNYLQEVSNE